MDGRPGRLMTRLPRNAGMSLRRRNRRENETAGVAAMIGSDCARGWVVLTRRPRNEGWLTSRNCLRFHRLRRAPRSWPRPTASFGTSIVTGWRRPDVETGRTRTPNDSVTCDRFEVQAFAALEYSLGRHSTERRFRGWIACSGNGCPARICRGAGSMRLSACVHDRTRHVRPKSVTARAVGSPTE